MNLCAPRSILTPYPFPPPAPAFRFVLRSFPSRVFSGLSHGDNKPWRADLCGGCTSGQSHRGSGAAEEGQCVPTGATAHFLGGGASIFIWVLSGYNRPEQGRVRKCFQSCSNCSNLLLWMDEEMLADESSWNIRVTSDGGNIQIILVGHTHIWTSSSKCPAMTKKLYYITIFSKMYFIFRTKHVHIIE